jgi:hypothetical protein
VSQSAFDAQELAAILAKVLGDLVLLAELTADLLVSG